MVLWPEVRLDILLKISLRDNLGVSLGRSLMQTLGLLNNKPE